MILRILKITDSKPGHITFTDGVIDAISQTYSVEVVQLDISIRFKFFLRIMKLIINNDWSSKMIRNSEWLLTLFYKNYQRPSGQFDLIISRGGDTSFINIWLAGILDAKNIYCSGLRGIRPEHFSLIISTLNLNLKNSITLEFAPAKAGSHNLYTNVEQFCDNKKINKKEKYFVLLIGGNDSEYKYKNEDFENALASYEFVLNQPTSEYSENALLKAADLSYDLGKYDTCL